MVSQIDNSLIDQGSADPSSTSRAPAEVKWASDEVLVVDGTEFLVFAEADDYQEQESTASRFVLAKNVGMVNRLVSAVADLAPRRIVDLGIYKGGSTALLAALARPIKLTAIDVVPERLAALDQFIAAWRLADVVRAHYGVDQGDSGRLAALLEEDHGGKALDLVVDDASHLLRETRTAFEQLFGRLRPGGRYIIEDWGWAHFPEPLWQDGGGWFHDRPALTNLIVELLMIAATGPGLVSKITVLRDTVTVERGLLTVPGPLCLEDHYCNRGLPFRPLL